MKSMNEITPESLDQNIQKLREEFNKKSFYNENHPKTSHEYKRAMVAKKMNRTNKALSANKIKWSNLNKLNDKEMLEFYRKHPGYLYYKEIMANMKIKQFNNVGKKRAFTGKEFNNKKIIKDYNNNYNYRKLGNTNYNHGNNLYKNFNINNINISIKDKKNPYSLSWVNKILNQNDYKLEIKPKDIILKEKEKEKHNKVNINNYMKNKDIKEIKDNKVKDDNKIKNDNKEKDVNGEKKEEKLNDDKEEELTEEQQMQFYKIQKNFFKARKDIKEEPEDLEEDNDEDNNKDKEKNNN